MAALHDNVQEQQYEFHVYDEVYCQWFVSTSDEESGI